MEPYMKKTASARSGATLLLGVTGLTLGLPSVAFAQDGDSSSGTTLTGNEIVVTATKREQTLQDVPVAVSVTSGEAIERAQIRDLQDLQTIVPSLRVTQLQSSANTNFIIRGFGNGANNAGIEPSVGVFVDGVYRSRTASQINDLPNVSRIEVLRGPQSTLFGKNASAGVISIITEEPQFDFGGSAELGYGNYNAVVARGYVTGPVADTVAVSLAGGYNARDGYIRDLGTGNRTNERNRYFVRGQLLIEPSSDFKARFIADYDSIDEICCGVVNLARSPSPGATDVIELLGGRVSDYRDPYAGVVYSNVDSTNDIQNWGVSAQFDYNIGNVTLTSITAFRNNSAITSQDPDFSSADLINPIAADINLDTFTQELRLTAELGDRVNLLLGGFYISEKVKQTGALRWGTQARPYASALINSLSAEPQTIGSLEQTIGFLESGDPGKYATDPFFAPGTGFSEYFGLDSEAFSIFGQLDFEVTDRLTLTLGGNYTKDIKDYSARIDSTDSFSRVDLIAVGNTAIYQQGVAQQVGQILGYAPTPQQIMAFASDPATAATFAAISTGVQAFADANDTNPAVNPLLALRQLQYLPPFLEVPNAVEDGHISDDDFAYTIRLAYDLTDNVNVYASYATGFKAASVNLSRDSRPLLADRSALIAGGLAQVNQTYGTRFAAPEESTVYEFGVKGNFGRASANLAVFQQEIEGFQSNVFTGSGFALANAGKQSTFGVEFEGMAEVARGLTFNLGVTYLDPIYDEFLLSAVGDLSGTRPGGIPEWTIVVGGQYEHELGNGDRIFLNASYHHESEVQINEGLPAFLVRNPDGTIDAGPALAAAAPFTREVNDVSASITYAMENGLEFSVWGRNLLNDRYLLQVFDSVAQPLSISGYPNQPRTWGGAVRFKW